MNVLKRKKHRLYIALAAAAIAALLTVAVPAEHVPRPPETAALAWWGTIYPGFCFAERPEGEQELRTSFWIAELLKTLTAEKP